MMFWHLAMKLFYKVSKTMKINLFLKAENAMLALKIFVARKIKKDIDKKST